MVDLSLDELRCAVACIDVTIYEDRYDDKDEALREKLQALIDELDPPKPRPPVTLEAVRAALCPPGLLDTGDLLYNCRCVSVIVDDEDK